MNNLTEVNFTDIRNIFNASYRKRDKVTQFGQSINNPNLTNVEDPTNISCIRAQIIRNDAKAAKHKSTTWRNSPGQLRALYRTR